MKKTMAVLLAALMLVAAWIPFGAVAEEKPSLTVWFKKEVNETTNEMLAARAKEFGEKNNIDVNVEIIAYEKLYPMWTAAIEAGTLPDISYFQYQEAGQFYAQDLLLDLTDLCEKIQVDNGNFIQALITPATFGGKVYAIPQKFYSVAIHYRKDMFEAAGITQPPATWDELREVAKKLTDEASGVYGAGMGLGATNSDAEWLNQVMLWALGGSIVDEDSRTIVCNSPETVAAFTYMADFYKNDGSIPPSAVNWDDAANNTAYLSGQAAMVVNAGTLLAALKNDNPELYENTGVAQLPSGPNGSFVPSAGSYLGAFNTTEYPEEAKALIAYLYDYDWYNEWMSVEMPSIVPVFEKAKEDPMWQEEKLAPFVESMEALSFIGYPGEYTPAAGEVFNLKLINATLEKIVVLGMEPQAACDELQAQVEEIFSAY